MCRNGRYTERGIKEIDGYAAQLWTVESDYAVKLDARMADVGTLMEPTTVVVKAGEQVDRIGARAWYEPRTVLVTGAGPIGLLLGWLRQLITRRVPLERFADALNAGRDDIKVVLTLSDQGR